MSLDRGLRSQEPGSGLEPGGAFGAAGELQRGPLLSRATGSAHNPTVRPRRPRILPADAGSVCLHVAVCATL